MDSDELKLKAAEHAITYVKPGMTLGLGTGSTAAKFVDLLGEKVAGGLEVVCIATSEQTAAQAKSLSIPMTTLDEHPVVNLVVDGADEVDEHLNLIKGGGGALLREKIVAMASERMVVIADETKLVKKLGAFPLPIEVVPFGLKATIGLTAQMIKNAGHECTIQVRHDADGAPFKTDGGHLILDCAIGPFDDPVALSDALTFVPGIVEHGLFVGVADTAIIAGQEGVTLIESTG